MPLNAADRAELDTLKSRLERSLTGGDGTLSEAEIDRLGVLRAQERADIIAVAQERQKRETVRGVQRIALALAAQQRRT